MLQNSNKVQPQASGTRKHLSPELQADAYILLLKSDTITQYLQEQEFISSFVFFPVWI